LFIEFGVGWKIILGDRKSFIISKELFKREEEMLTDSLTK
jgi:hypothetical protein